MSDCCKGIFYLLDARLARIERMLRKLTRASESEEERDEMAQADIDKLKEAVAANTDVVASAVTLIQGLVEQVKAVADDPAELQAAIQQLEAGTQALAEAVAANTPAQG